jgi:glycosyltransferase involved in cell wall biosynthesis
MKIAVITPYYKENFTLINRCIDSIASQSVKTDHFLISDGHPEDWIDQRDVRHIRLGASHGDYGNTPRGIGAQIAISEGYDAIAFLDADNWFDLNHIESCINSAKKHISNHGACDYVVARRRLMRPDLTEMPWTDAPELVDTNCFFLLRGAYSVVPYWNLMPKPFSVIGDRIFNAKIQSLGFVFAQNDNVTVNYLNLWESTYKMRGETPPPGAKSIDPASAFEWFKLQSEEDKIIIQRLLGLNVDVK